MTSNNWTSISVYAPVRERVEEVREGQSYNELFREMCEQYDPGEADHDYQYEPSEEEKEERNWETISIYQSTYDEIVKLKQDDETFNDLFIKMVRQYQGAKSTA
ncbi:antitoxin VapB family protein [Halomicrobium salinisoli]|uniref:antitoxin VapB family protein n=1 Tax=Halomicrobium salinisoli TaxID=2878391 RepID=UPI001CF0D4B3|nr:antitoxin VapB family protein [Halomicrobium salinisoli]